ncbi:MAG: DUF2975 domain-containing protein [Micrococcales bacterium]|nr:DUF2975 domain-containing protein [Micrococcales bacterium]
MLGVTYSGIVAPLVRLVSRTFFQRAGEEFAWQAVDPLPVVLNGEGIAAVYGSGAECAGPACGVSSPQWVTVDGASLTPQTTAEVMFDRLGWAEFLATTGSNLLESLLLLVGLFALYRLIRTIRQYNPFDPRNAGRLYFAGAAFMISAAVSWVLGANLGGYIVTNDPTLSRLVLVVGELDFTPAVFGIGLILMGEVFRVGTRLRSDTAGLV